MTKIIAIANFKGGVGKTTSVLNIGAAMARAGKRTLLIDLDPQANLTNSLDVTVKDSDTTIYKILRKIDKPKALQVADCLFIIPSSLELNKAELELSSEFKREEILGKVLKPYQTAYDYVLLDCPPSLGLLTINAFVAADYILVPIEAEYLALKGYAILNEAIGAVGLDIDRVFITKYDSRKILNRDVKESIESALQDKLFKTLIRDNIALAEAPAQGLDIFRYSPKSYGAEDYEALCREILAVW